MNESYCNELHFGVIFFNRYLNIETTNIISSDNKNDYFIKMMMMLIMLMTMMVLKIIPLIIMVIMMMMI